MVLLLAAGIVKAAAPVQPTISAFFIGPGPEYYPRDIAVDAVGNVYVADSEGLRVQKITPGGVATVVAGNGTPDFNGDNIAATAAGMTPWGVEVDKSGNLFIADRLNNRVRKVLASGTIVTIAGTGASGFNGDGGPATAATLDQPDDVALDAGGNLFIVDAGNQRVRKVAPSGLISTIAGNGQKGYNGDGGPAKQASLNGPRGIDVDQAGNVYIADFENYRVRQVDVAGKIRTVAGGGDFGNDVTAVHLQLLAPQDLVVDGKGNLFIAMSTNLVRVVSPSGATSIIAGTLDPDSHEGGGLIGYEGDGGPAHLSKLGRPESIGMDADGSLYVADAGSFRIRKITPIPPLDNPPGFNAFSPYALADIQAALADVVVGDVTGDGLEDVVFSTTTSNTPDPIHDYSVGIMVQGADGNLAAPSYVRYPSPPIAGQYRFLSARLALADFNRDGMKDIVVGHESGISLVLGSRTNAFVARSFSAAATTATDQLLVLDINRDGISDLVSGALPKSAESSLGQPGIAIYHGNGTDGGATRSFIEVPFYFGAFSSGDLNGDGKVDLAARTNSVPIGPPGFAVFLNDGARGFLPPSVRLTPNDTYDPNLSVGDYNSDGRDDIVLAYKGLVAASPYPLLNLYTQDATGQLIGPAALQTHDNPDTLLTVDMDRDGRDDLLVAHLGERAIGYYQNMGDRLGNEAKYPVPDNFGTVRIAVGDINRDNFPDVVRVDPAKTMTILYGKSMGTRTRVNGSMPRVPHGTGPIKPAVGSLPPVEIAGGPAPFVLADGGRGAMEGFGRPYRLLPDWGVTLLHRSAIETQQRRIRATLERLLGNTPAGLSSLIIWLGKTSQGQHPSIELPDAEAHHPRATRSIAGANVLFRSTCRRPL